jgi:TonB family protein
MSGLIVHRVQPTYPDLAKQSKIEGVVVLGAIIDECGHVVDLKPITGPPELTAATVTAVKQWEYKPFLLSGRPRVVATRVRVKFKLDDTLSSVWKEYAYPETSFAITLPEEPHPHGSSQMPNAIVYSVTLPDGARFSLHTEEANDRCVDTVRDQLDNAKNTAESRGFTVLSFREVEGSGYAGVEFIQKVPTGKIDYERWICGAKRLYVLASFWDPGESRPKELQRIVDSFRLITKK